MSVRLVIAVVVLLGLPGASNWAAPPSFIDLMEERVKHRVTVPELINAFNGKDEHLRKLAAGALNEMGADASEALPTLIAALNDRNAFVRGYVAGALASMGPRTRPVFPALVKALKDSDWVVRCKAAGALVRAGADTGIMVPALTRMLKDKSRYVPQVAVRLLGDLGPAAAPAIPDLRGFLRRGWPEAAEALGKIGPVAKGAVPELTKMLNDKPATPQTGDDGEFEKQDHAHKQIAAALALWRIDHERPAIKVLMHLLEDKDRQYGDRLFHVREYAAIALGKIGRRARPAVPLLMRALQDENDRVREAAAGALGGIGPQARAAAAPLGLLVRSDESVSETAAEALGKLGPGARAAIADLRRVARPWKVANRIKGLKDTKQSLRVAACRALWRIEQKAEHALPGLLETLEVQEVWSPFGPRSYLRLDAADLRRQAAEVLGSVGASARAAIPALRTLAEKDEFLTIREAALAAMKEIEGAE
jgi:HEAT repeat protein